jgi:MSHA biogenesis protein MshL
MASFLRLNRYFIARRSLYSIGIISACLLSLSLNGCQSRPIHQPTMPQLVDVTMSQALQDQIKADSPTAPSVDIAASTEKVPTEKTETYDIAANDVPARDFFLSLVQEMNTNIIVHPEVTGTLSINLKEVTLAEIMETAETMYDLHIEQKGNTYYIYPAQLSTRIYKIDYLNIKRTGSSSMSVVSGQISSGGSSSSGSSSSSSRNSGSSSTSGTEVTTESEVDFWGDLKTTLVSMIGSDEGKEVIINPQTGLVAIKAQSKDHAAIAAFLDNMQSSLGKQVVIEAKILEVELNQSFQSGINWDVVGKPNGKDISAKLEGQAVNGGDINGLFKINLALGDFTSIISLLETQGDVRVLSSPRISTVNNQKAVIKVGQDEFFVTNISQSTTTSSTTAETNNSPEVELTPFFSGIALDVTPQISDGNEVILHVHPTVSEVSEKTKVIDLGEDNVLSLPLAVSSIRETDSIVKAENNQVIILGGLLQSTEEKQNANIPWIDKIPLIGRLFNQHNFIGKKSELVILLKPQIVNQFTWSALLKDSKTYLENNEQTSKPSTMVFK